MWDRARDLRYGPVPGVLGAIPAGWVFTHRCVFVAIRSEFRMQCRVQYIFLSSRWVSEQNEQIRGANNTAQTCQCPWLAHKHMASSTRFR